MLLNIFQKINNKKRDAAENERKEEAIRLISEKTGVKASRIEKDMRRTRRKFGISYAEFARYRLDRYPFEQRGEEYRKRKAEKESVKARRSFILGFNCDEKEEIETDAQTYQTPDISKMYDALYERAFPDGIMAAASYLGCSIPSGADPRYCPSAYVCFDGSDIESIRRHLGERCIPDTDGFNNERQKFKKKYYSIKTLDHNMTDLAIYYTDYVMHCMDAGFTATDYFDFRFYLRSSSDRLEFLSDKGFKRYVRRVCNKDLDLFRDKRSFNTVFKKCVCRDWIDIREDSFEDFKEFISRHPVFFAKPAGGTGGENAVRIDSRIEGSLESLFDDCRNKDLIIEECVKQHPDMALFNNDSLNTVRLYTLVDIDDHLQVLGAIARFGRKGKVVDNFHKGGVCAIVDVDTGAIISDAMDIHGVYYKAHPDSNKPFKGSRIPEWNKVMAAVEVVALQCSDINRHAGWDVAVTENGEAEIIEANSTPNFDILQSIDQSGRREIYEKFLTPLALRSGIKVYDPRMRIPEAFRRTAAGRE